MGRVPNGVLHTYMLPNSNSLRPNQDRDLGSLAHWFAKAAKVESSTYDPAGDAGARQEQRTVRFTDKLYAKELHSTQTIDIWTSDYRNFVYPHLCSTAGVPSPDYLTTSSSDNAKINGLTSDPGTYAAFMALVNDATRAEYGAAADLTNPYWIARSVSEFIRENFDYGVPDEKEWKPGEGVWNPVQYKLQRFLEGSDANLLTCSSTAFCTEALCRSALVPARWVGTTRFRNSWTDGFEGYEWDADKDGLMGMSESSTDESYHRWAEVWLGTTYGWQRFDGTPASTKYEQSQWDMMDLCAHGVDYKDLVTTVGKGYISSMFDAAAGQQYYNTCGHYDGDKWKQPDKAIYWQVPCYVFVDTPHVPVSTDWLTVTWTLSGSWDLDPDATLSIYAVATGTTDRIPLAARIAADAGALTVNIRGTFADGVSYTLWLIKDGDEITGGHSNVFLYEAP